MGEGQDWVQEMERNLPRKEEMIVAQLTEHYVKKIFEIPSKETKQLDPMILEDLEKGEGIQAEEWRDCKTVMDLVNGKPRERTARGAIGGIQRQLRTLWSNKINMRAEHMFSRTQKPTLERKRSQRSRRGLGK